MTDKTARPLGIPMPDSMMCIGFANAAAYAHSIMEQLRDNDASTKVVQDAMNESRYYSSRARHYRTKRPDPT